MKKRWLGILLALCLLVCFAPAALAAETDSPVDPIKVYVDGEQGNDTTGDGSQKDAYATLAKAVNKVADGGTVYVMSDLTSNQVAKVWDKSITITSEAAAMEENGGKAFVITRASNFNTVQDSARSTYNPAMIEVGGETDNDIVASLLLENIVLDDAGKTGGNEDASELYFMQAQGSGGTTGGISNTDIVQDAIVATYNGKGAITLGEGAVLKNFGGMSAVRLSGGQLTMLDGSLICDDTVTTRLKGKVPEGVSRLYYGPAGAIWLQSGNVVMESGSKIDNVVGRSIYNENGTATIGGTISNCKTVNNVMWQCDGNSTPGYVVYLRMGATMTLTKTGRIEDTAETPVRQNGSSIYIMGGSKLITEEGSIICNMAPSDRIISGIGEAYGDINGEVYGCNPGYGIITFQGASIEKPYYAKIGPSAALHDNTCWYGVVYVQSPGTIDFYGKIYNNINSTVGGGIVLANNGTNAKVTMYPGAEITNNVLNCGGNAGENGGGGVSVRCGTFVMKGGTISNNIVTANGSGAGVQVLRGGIFIMNDGEIKNNATAGLGGGVSYNGNDYNDCKPNVQINGGTISGNKMNVTVSETDGVYSVTGGASNDLSVLTTEAVSYGGAAERYYVVSDSATIGNADVYMQKYDFTLIDPQRDTKLGNASTDGETALKDASTEKGWSNTLLASFWAQADNNQTWVLSGLTKTNVDLPVYALVMPTNAAGNVGADTEATVYAVTVNADGTWSFTVPGGKATGYVVGLVQPSEDYGTLTLVANPATLTEDVGGTVNYTATYKPAENLISQLADKDTFTLTITLAPGMTYVKDSFTGPTDASVSGNTITITGIKKQQLEAGFTAKFSATALDTIKAGDTFVTNAVLKGNATKNNANAAVTLVATATVTVTAKPEDPIEPTDPPYIPPVDPDEPADPDDTGVSDLLNTKDHIQYLFGYPDGTFGPENNMTRAEVAQMFYNLLLDQDVEITKTFDDVPANAWYAKAVNTLASLDIISGVGDNKFEPERSITRAEFTSMAMKFAVGGEEGENIFSDVDEDDWFYDAVVNSIQYGWIHGYGDGTFRPNNPITRAEVTAIVNNMLGRAADEDFVDEHAEELTQFSDIEKHWAYYHIVEATNDHDYTKPSSGENWTKLN